MPSCASIPGPRPSSRSRRTSRAPTCARWRTAGRGLGRRVGHQPHGRHRQAASLSGCALDGRGRVPGRSGRRARARLQPQAFEPCQACHALTKDAGQKPGPQLVGLIGRPVAGDPAFDYSPALRAARDKGDVWTGRLDLFLSDPRGDVSPVTGWAARPSATRSSAPTSCVFWAAARLGVAPTSGRNTMRSITALRRPAGARRRHRTRRRRISRQADPHHGALCAGR